MLLCSPTSSPPCHPFLLIIQLRRRLEANAEVEELQKRVKVLQVRMEREKHRAGELETALRASRESASSASSPPSSSKEHSAVNNKVKVTSVTLWIVFSLNFCSMSDCKWIWQNAASSMYCTVYFPSIVTVSLYNVP